MEPAYSCKCLQYIGDSKHNFLESFPSVVNTSAPVYNVRITVLYMDLELMQVLIDSSLLKAYHKEEAQAFLSDESRTPNIKLCVDLLHIPSQYCMSNMLKYCIKKI